MVDPILHTIVGPEHLKVDSSTHSGEGRGQRRRSRAREPERQADDQAPAAPDADTFSAGPGTAPPDAAETLRRLLERTHAQHEVQALARPDVEPPGTPPATASPADRPRRRPRGYRTLRVDSGRLIDRRG